jgi:hypothetical protein
MTASRAASVRLRGHLRARRHPRAAQGFRRPWVGECEGCRAGEVLRCYRYNGGWRLVCGHAVQTSGLLAQAQLVVRGFLHKSDVDVAASSQRRLPPVFPLFRSCHEELPQNRPRPHPAPPIPYRCIACYSQLPISFAARSPSRTSA